MYKVQSSKESVAEMVKQYWKPETEASDILIWTERGADIPALRACERYFTKLDIPYEFILDDGKSNIKKRLNPTEHQVVFPFFQQHTTVIANMRNLGIEEDFPNTVFVIPEEWLDIEALEVDYLNKLNVHFFSDYFVSEENDNTVVFISNFVERYNTPPDLKRFSFQGYDITSVEAWLTPVVLLSLPELFGPSATLMFPVVSTMPDEKGKEGLVLVKVPT